MGRHPLCYGLMSARTRADNRVVDEGARPPQQPAAEDGRTGKLEDGVFTSRPP
jgi:hypothetical protein